MRARHASLLLLQNECNRVAYNLTSIGIYVRAVWVAAIMLVAFPYNAQPQPPKPHLQADVVLYEWQTHLEQVQRPLFA